MFQSVLSLALRFWYGHRLAVVLLALNTADTRSPSTGLTLTMEATLAALTATGTPTGTATQAIAAEAMAARRITGMEATCTEDTAERMDRKPTRTMVGRAVSTIAKIPAVVERWCEMSNHRVFSIVVVLIVGVAYVAVPCAGVAAAKKRSQHRGSSAAKQAAQRRAIQAAIQRTSAQVQAAKRVGAAAAQQAGMAQAKVQVAEGRANAALSDIESAEAEARAATEGLNAIEAEIEQAQSAGSEFARARAALESAEKEFQASRERVLSSPAYKAKYQAALKSGNRAGLLDIRNDALKNDTAFQAASYSHEEAETAFGRIRRELHLKNPDWVAAAEAARETRAELARAKKALSGSMLHRAGGRSNLREATKTVAAAQATAQQGEAAIKRLQSSQKRLSKPKKSSYRRR